MGTKSIIAISLITVLLIGAVSFDDAFAKDKKEKLTKLQKECAKEPKKENKIKANCELLELIIDVDVDPSGDSFFDVFFDVELYSVDSFFDIFTELQTAFADTSSDIQQVLGLLNNPIFGLEEIKDEVRIIETEVQDPNTGLAAIKTAVDNIDTSGSGGIPARTQTQINNIETETNKIQMIKDDLNSVENLVSALGNSYVPFTKTLVGSPTPGTSAFAQCTLNNLNNGGTDTDYIVIDSSGSTGTILVERIMLKISIAAADDIAKITEIKVDGIRSSPLGQDFPDITGSRTLSSSFELLGGDRSDDSPTKLPSQLTAENNGPNDIVVEFRCESTTRASMPVSILTVSGWKLAGETVDVSWNEERP